MIIKLNASKRLEQWTLSDSSSDARFNFNKDEFTVLKFDYCFLHH